MLIREITKQNIKEIILLPLIFILLFIGGSTVFLVFNIYDQILYASWCFISAIIVIGLIGLTTYLMIKNKI